MSLEPSRVCHETGLPSIFVQALLHRRRYWEVDDTVSPDENKVPYRLEVVGVTCDPGLAVARGIWRKVRHPSHGIHEAHNVCSRP